MKHIRERQTWQGTSIDKHQTEQHSLLSKISIEITSVKNQSSHGRMQPGHHHHSQVTVTCNHINTCSKVMVTCSLVTVTCCQVMITCSQVTVTCNRINTFSQDMVTCSQAIIIVRSWSPVIRS